MRLTVTNLSAGYGRVPVLRGISIEAGTGQIVALLGANGAGKTTLLRAISGLATIHGGSVSLLGSNLARLSAVQRVKAGLIHVPQGRHLFASMSVRENLEMGGYLLGSARTAETRMQEVFELFPILRERAHRAAAILSGGEQQMLALGRALMSGPRLLLLDEPSLGLAPKTFSLILEAVRQINECGTTVLVAEQNAAKVLRLAHYAYVIENGRIAAEGDGPALLANGQIRESYLGAV